MYLAYYSAEIQQQRSAEVFGRNVSQAPTLALSTQALFTHSGYPIDVYKEQWSQNRIQFIKAGKERDS